MEGREPTGSDKGIKEEKEIKKKKTNKLIEE